MVPVFLFLRASFYLVLKLEIDRHMDEGWSRGGKNNNSSFTCTSHTPHDRINIIRQVWPSAKEKKRINKSIIAVSRHGFQPVTSISKVSLSWNTSAQKMTVLVRSGHGGYNAHCNWTVFFKPKRPEILKYNLCL